ncbi:MULTISPECIES: tetratricopeptide repeat protein [unclassified Modicisalibacter]|uniref:tetratricopeptide repeat protein n=1 Tax=unclassified Modicisalibacter TaxID=2679913 RepID=UPI001CCE9EEE|nr:MULTISPECIES: tetratricopeptide repeat protein [unclassified Modicisalibacter]MBZ9557237.1 tetratricopeptide repeat protein [Modicisalibacter sp. R2A 31.J]MBZ9574049.1 tetratricopeptide repeat protein [Modicisalibacter sp. MOD 31.J]
MHARWLVTTLTATWLAGCQSLTPPPTQVADPMATAPPIESGLDADSLATLITAELAGQRGQFGEAAQGYLKTARRYHSPALAERATLAARYADDPSQLTRAAETWQALAPDAEAPARLLAGIAQQRGDWTGSLEQRLTLARRDGQGDLTGFAEAALEQGAALPPLIARLRRFIDHQPDHPDALLATALLEAGNGNVQRADERLDRLAARHPDLPDLWLAKTRIALQQGRDAAARDAAKRGLDLAPDDSRLILLLAQAQLRLGNVDAAQSQLDALIAQHADAPQLRLALAQLYLGEGYPDPAKRLLLPLIDDEPSPPLAFILLGNVAEQEGEIDNALLYYRQVPPGDGFLEARQRGARMLADAGRLSDARTFLHIERLRHPEAFGDLIALEVDLLGDQGEDTAADALLDRALSSHPDDVQLRFMRAMRHYHDDDLAGMERNLRYILERHPDNATALNALGYTLADETSRLDEARQLIEHAHRLAPDDPAIIDSMGWLQHRLGNDEAALPYLRDAYRRQPDPEIAAHLAEVLWRLGHRSEARALVADTLERFDTHPPIDDLIQRLPSLAPASTQPE